MSESRARLLRIVETGVMVGLAVALSTLKLFEMPQGGTVTPGSMIPILLIALRHGPKWGIAAGLIDGLLQYVVDGYVVHPVQFLLDYPIAYAVLGLAGFAAGRSETLGAWLGALAIFGRFAAHTLAGVVFFAEFAGDQNVWVYSATYNGTYLLPELVISAVLLMALLPALRRALPTGIRPVQRSV